MKCIYCNHPESKVVDSRSTTEGNSIRRRRECLNCSKRFTTYETIEMSPMLVIKSGGERQPFDKEKIKRGLIKACEKRPVTMEQIDNMVLAIEKKAHNNLRQEIESGEIGNLVMETLKEVDKVAYIRFASVYRQFEDVTSFENILKEIK